MLGVGQPTVFQNSFWACVASVWLAVWAIRRRGELDHELDSTAKLIRWLIAVCGLTLWPMIGSSTLRMSVGFTGMLFLVWPNTAYHLTRLLRFLHVLPKAKAGGLDNPNLT
jgi:hypothetical protein